MPLCHKALRCFAFILPVLVFFYPFSAIGEYQIEVTPRFVVGQEYDDNIDLDPENKKSDYITTVSPGIKINAESAKNGLSLDYAPTWVRYWDYEENDTVRHNGKIDLWYLFTKYLRLDLNDNYLKSEEPHEEGEDGAIQTIRHTRNNYERNDASISLDYQFGSQDHIKGGYAYQILNNEDPALTDSTEHGPFASLIYWFDFKNGMELDYRFSTAEYELESGLPSEDDFDGHEAGARYTHRFDPHTNAYVCYGLTTREFDIETNDYQIHDFSVGLNYGLSPQTSISLASGFYKPNGDPYDSEDAKLFFSAGLEHETKNLKMSLEATKGWDEGFFEAERRGFTEYWTSRGRIEYQPTKHMTTYASISYRKNDYMLETKIDDDTYQGECGLEISFLRWYTLGLDYTHSQRLSDDLDAEYTDNRIMLTLSASRLFQWK
jgi:hypothetical protein